jgi:hypothetical protein
MNGLILVTALCSSLNAQFKILCCRATCAALKDVSPKRSEGEMWRSPRRAFKGVLVDVLFAHSFDGATFIAL